MPDQVRHDGFGTFYETVKVKVSRKAAELAKKNNKINFLKNLRVFAPLRETFSITVYPGWAFLILGTSLSSLLLHSKIFCQKKHKNNN